MVRKILESPITIFSSIISGCLAGLYIPNFIKSISIINDVYIKILTMIALPLIICAIIINVRKIFQEKGMLKILVILLLGMMFFSALLGVGLSSAFKSFIKPDDSSMIVLNKMDDTGIADSFGELNVYNIDKNVENFKGVTIKDFFVNIFPDNIFAALANNQILQVIIFCIIFGSMLSFVPSKYSQTIISILEGVYEALYKFLDAAMVFVPFLLFMTMANIFTDESMVKLFGLFFNYILVYLIAMFSLILIAFIFVNLFTGRSITKQIVIMKRTIFTAIGTGSNLATTMVCVEDATKLGIDKNIVSSVLPISTLLCPIADIADAALLATFATIIYDIKLSLSVIVIIAVSSIFFAISISTVSTLVQVTMLTLIFTPLGLPTTVAAPIFILLGSIFDYVQTFCSIYTNLAITAVVDKKMKNKI